MTPLSERAAAKVNLSLRILGRRPDGYHELQSLTAFADVGDELTLTPGDALDLAIDGPFGAELAGDNLILDAARVYAEMRPGGATGTFRLHKLLPIAAGLGGGSADAAAAIRLLMRADGASLPPADMQELCAGIGADVRVCIEQHATLMWGIGEKLIAVPPLPPLAAVLVNPGVPLSTRAVFEALAIGDAPGHIAKPEPIGTFADATALAAYLHDVPNDLQTTAETLEPSIVLARSTLEAAAGNLLTRLSGSGPTVFGLFADREHADRAASRISDDHPDWWVKPTVLI